MTNEISKLCTPKATRCIPDARAEYDSDEVLTGGAGYYVKSDNQINPNMGDTFSLHSLANTWSVNAFNLGSADMIIEAAAQCAKLVDSLAIWKLL